MRNMVFIRPKMRILVTCLIGLASTACQTRSNPCLSQPNHPSTHPKPLSPTPTYPTPHFKRRPLLHLSLFLSQILARSSFSGLAAASTLTRTTNGREQNPSLATLPVVRGGGRKGEGLVEFEELIRCRLVESPDDQERYTWVRVRLTVPEDITKSAIKDVENTLPVCIIVPGFLLKADQYDIYSRALASRRCLAVSFDIPAETLSRQVDDVDSYNCIPQILDWMESAYLPISTCSSNTILPTSFSEYFSACSLEYISGPSDFEIRALSRPLLTQETQLLTRAGDTSRVMLVGHSRGAKLAVLSAQDPRVKSLFLIDPVDNTKYAPKGPRFPSALDYLRSSESRNLPMAIVGAGRGFDCAPRGSNFEQFFGAAKGRRVEVVFPEAGHFQFVDPLTDIERSICAEGRIPGDIVRNSTAALLALWADATLGEANLGLSGFRFDDMRKVVEPVFERGKANMERRHTRLATALNARSKSRKSQGSGGLVRADVIIIEDTGMKHFGILK
mmetsp:Transcript_9362/g.14781  ORF Transcript_9362/g.14781 Transcript_9362/m.14781 type:complete len:503 (-) Transcript_9362:80-1588(-)